MRHRHRLKTIQQHECLSKHSPTLRQQFVGRPVATYFAPNEKLTDCEHANPKLGICKDPSENCEVCSQFGPASCSTFSLSQRLSLTDGNKCENWDQRSKEHQKDVEPYNPRLKIPRPPRKCKPCKWQRGRKAQECKTNHTTESEILPTASRAKPGDSQNDSEIHCAEEHNLRWALMEN